MPLRANSFAAAAALALLTAGGGCAGLSPSNSRDWTPDQTALATADIRPPLVHVRNVRNCRWQSETDYTVAHYDKTYDLEKLDSVWFIVVPFPELPKLAHTMLSFGFGDEDYLCVSVEIRKEKGETYAPLKGSLRQFEIMYVVGDERDLIGVRTGPRMNEVYLYRTKATPEKARALFLDVMERVNALAAKPEYYNTFTNNCTTNIMRHVNRIAPNSVPYDLRVLFPGESDRYAYELGLLDTRLSFDQTRLAAKVNYQAHLYRAAADFSRQLRR